MTETVQTNDGIDEQEFGYNAKIDGYTNSRSDMNELGDINLSNFNNNMNIIKIENKIKSLFIKYFTKISNAYKLNLKYPKPEGVFYYPNLILITETPKHKIIEFLGVSDSPNNIKVKFHRSPTTTSYFNSFYQDSVKPQMNIDIGYMTLDGLVFTETDDYDEVVKRYPGIYDFTKVYRLFRKKGNGSLISFGNSIKFIELKNLLFINKKSNFFRIKYIHLAFVINKNYSNSQILESLNDKLEKENIMGIVEINSTMAKKAFIINQFQSLFILNRIRETNIGQFLNQNKELFLDVFDSEEFRYEPYLKWDENIENIIDKAINPDIILIKSNRDAIVIDIKTALLNKLKITKGPKKRRRFIDYVNEGIAQLAHYKDYLYNKLNSNEINDKIGKNLNFNRFVLIVGTYENINEKEVTEALRAFNNIEIIDFDSLANVFMSK